MPARHQRAPCRPRPLPSRPMTGTPRSPSRATRAPRDLRFAIIGAGMAGILSGDQAAPRPGSPTSRSTRRATGFGGTWRENTYPGLACDVPSHLYSYSFAPNPDWSHRFSPGPEIHAYFERVARRARRRAGDVRFGDEVVRCEFADGRWQLETAGGHRDEVDVVIAATGVLHHPKYPDIEGLDSFAGAMFHSARWDHDVPLDGARVGVIGTGSTAVQIVGAIVDRVGAPVAVPAHRAVDHAAGEPGVHRRGEGAFRRDPRSSIELHDEPRRGCSASSPTRSSTRTRRRSR